MIPGCGKEGQFKNTKIYGKITDKITGQPLSGVSIQLYIGDGTGQPSRFDELENTTTYSDGNYEINFSARSKYQYYILVRKYSYLSEHFDGIKKGNKIEKSFALSQ